jgi:hypothetical protein
MSNLTVNPYASPGVKEFVISPTLSAREAEVLSDQVMLCMGEGVSRFRFRLAPEFLPAITWLERARLVLSPVVEKKFAVEILCYPSQKKSLFTAGFHLMADVGFITTAT